MQHITFEQLPTAFTYLYQKVENIERLLQQEKNAVEGDRWFDLSELCQYLPDKPAKPTVYGWVHTCEIPNHKRGKKLYFLKSEIDAWLRVGRKKTVAELQEDAHQDLLTKNKRG